ncbi:DUF4844 domain-containing protein [Verrucomicrobiota bacterium sgz303538]
MNVSVTPETLSRLRQLQQKRKFAETDFYPGAPTEDIRTRCERHVDHFVERVVGLLQRGAPKEAFIAQGNELQATFQHEDTEERERVGDYIDECMRIIGIDYWDPKNGEDPKERARYFGFKSE